MNSGDRAYDGAAGARDAASSSEITAEELRETFPQWRIFQSGEIWWATRGGRQHWDGPESLLLRAIRASDLPGLAESLCMQHWLEGLDEQALAAVYKSTWAEPC